VQIETNGVLSLNDFPFLHPRCHVVCSPKTSRISKDVYAMADAFKYVLRVGEIAEDGLPTRALGHAATPFVARPRKDARVYVQPMDEQDEVLNKRNTVAAIDSAMLHGYILQIQVHKVIGLD
jgi:organic radical activating enzyme